MIDRVEISVRGGSGGNGIVSFRREKWVPRGGPDGGDGGQGGDVVLTASENVGTLRDLRYKRHYRADDGGNGAGQRMHGRSGDDLVIDVPPGTQVRRLLPNGDTELIADLDQPGASLIAAHGGLGGRGNARFASSTNQAPRIAERGQRGQEAELILDLKLISDVGIIGLPNAGKSTLIASVSAARPKIADYPFTTLEPNLGVVDLGYGSFVMADIPGLIEGAHTGSGLGFDFLRHVERTRVLIHILDGSAPDPVADLELINRELSLFSEALAEKPQIVAINKIDLPDVAGRLAKLQGRLLRQGISALAISAATGAGVKPLLQQVAQMLDEARRAPAAAPASRAASPQESPRGADPVLRPQPRQRIGVVRDGNVYVVEGSRRLAAMAEMLDLSDEEARAEFEHRLQRLGALAILRRAGVRPGDRVRFGPTEITWRE